MTPLMTVDGPQIAFFQISEVATVQKFPGSIGVPNMNTFFDQLGIAGGTANKPHEFTKTGFPSQFFSG